MKNEKMPIAWHKERLKNHTEYLQREKFIVAGKQTLIEASELELAFLAKQISEAERQGLDGFDGMKFLKPKPTKQKP